jgi:hypothetical protein
MPHQVRRASLALLRWSGDLRGRQFQHGFDAGAAHHIDEFIDSHAAVLDQFHHGQQRLAVADQKLGELALADLSLVVNRMLVSFHGGSPFQGLITPILFRGNRRFNFPLRPRHRLVPRTGVLKIMSCILRKINFQYTVSEIRRYVVGA